MSLVEMSVALGVPKTSLFSIMKGLVAGDFVTFNRDTYSLGPEARRLGQIIVHGQLFPGCTLPVLENLGHAFRETIILGTLSDDRRNVVYTEVIEAESALRFSVKVGTHRPLNASAGGQAILSFLPADERKRYLASGPFERFTPRTVCTTVALRKVITAARREHCTMTIDGTIDQAVGIAAPYFDAAGEVKGALIIAAPTSRILHRQREAKASVIDGAQAISRILAYTGDYPPRGT